MEVSKTQKISCKIIFTLIACMFCLALVTPQQAEAGWLKKAWSAVKSTVSTACKAVTGFVKNTVEVIDAAADVLTGDGNEETVESAISLEDVGEVASIYFSTNSSPDASTGNIPGVGMLNSKYEDNTSVIAGNAGLFVAYGGKSWLSSLLTMATTSSSYDTFSNIPVSSSGGTKTNVVYDYACYGAVLATAGLDKTGYEVSVHMMNVITGGLIYLLYMLSIGLDMFFQIIFTVLKALNPFQLFYSGVNSVASSSKLKMSGYDTSTTAGGLANTAFAGLVTVLAKWYKLLYNFSWEVLIPIFFVVLVVSIVLFRHTGKWKSMLKKYIIRIAFLVIGIPLLSGIYTSALNSMSEDIGTGVSPATKIILSTFVDFESWAEHGRLSLNSADGTTLKLSSTTNNKGVRVASGTTKINVRNIAFQINKAYAFATQRAVLGDTLFTDYSYSSSNNEVVSVTVSEDIASTSANTSFQRSSIISTTTDILNRYMDGKYYTSGEFEALVKAQLTGWATTAEKGNVILNQFTTIVDVSSFYVSKDDECYKSHRGRLVDLYHFGTAIEEDTNNDDQLIETSGGNSSYAINIYANGGLKNVGGSYQDSGSTPTWQNSYGADSTGNTYTVAGSYGLSTCSMYNYLNTSFTTSALTCYSPSNIASTFVRKSHYSVNIVGTGLTSALYWLNCFMMLLCYVVVGYFYGLGMMFSNISRMFQVVKAVPFALLGTIKSIAELITYALVMILEVIGTIFLFDIIIEIMFSIPNIFTGTLYAAFNASDSNSLVNWGMPIILIFLAIFYGWFMMKALKVRKKFIKSLSEAAEEIVDKFLDVKTDVVAGGSPGAAGGKSVIGGALGGAAAGLGAAMASNTITKDAAKNEDGNGPDDGDDGPNGGNGVSNSATAINNNNADNSTENNNDDARIDNPDSNRDAIDKKEAGLIGTSLGDSKSADDSKSVGGSGKSIGERHGEIKEQAGLDKEARGLNKEANGLEKEAKGDDKVAKGEAKKKAGKDLKKKAAKDGAKGAAMSAMGVAAMSTPGTRLAGAGLYVAGKAQQVKSAAELAAAKHKESSGKRDVKSGEKMQAKGQKMQAKGQKIQKKGIEQQVKGQTKQVKAQDNKIAKNTAKSEKAQTKADKKAVKAQERTSAAAVAKRSQAQELRSTANTTNSKNDNKPKNVSGKQANAQKVQSRNANVSAGQSQQTTAGQTQSGEAPRKQSVRKAMINGARQGAAQVKANRAADGSLKQQYYQSKADTYSQNQKMENYHQKYGTPAAGQAQASAPKVQTVKQQQAPARPTQTTVVKQQQVSARPTQTTAPKTQTVKQNTVVEQNTVIEQRQQVVTQRQQVTQTKSDALKQRTKSTKNRSKGKKDE
jgi:hypothetical protein